MRDMAEFFRSVAIVVFTDGKNAIVQERGSHSKVGEKYGFWGGQIEEGESPDVALRREIREEMGFELKKQTYQGSFPFVVQEECNMKGKMINQEAFTAPISEIPEKLKIEKGCGVVKMSVQQVIEGAGFPIGSTYFVKDIF